MVSVSISHILGTITLVLVFVGVTMFYTMTYFSLQDRTLSRQLQEAADYVSANLIDLVSLAQISATDQFLVKSVSLPQNIGSDFFIITISEEKNEVQQKQLLVKAFFSSRPTIQMESVLPWMTIGTWNETLPVNNNLGLTPKVFLSSSTSNPAVWVWKQNSTITTGLGIVDQV